MKQILLMMLSTILYACSQDAANVVEKKKEAEATATVKASDSKETILVCEGITGRSLFGEAGKKDSFNVTLTKLNGKVVKAVTHHLYTFTVEKEDVRSKDSKGSIYVQLFEEPDQLILRRESTGDKVPWIITTIIKSSGAYTRNDPILSSASGQCQVREKVF